MIGKRAIIVFPNRDVDLGLMGDDELIVTGPRQSPGGVYFEAYVINRDEAVVDGEATAGPAGVDALAARVVRTGRTI
jgi:hypothetical protein